MGVDLMAFVRGSMSPDVLSSQEYMLSFESWDVAYEGFFFLIHISILIIEMR